MPRFNPPNPSPEPTAPQASSNRKPRRLLKPVLLVILGLLLISPIAYAEYLSAYTGVPPDIILKIFARATLTCGGFMGKLCPIGFKCATKGGGNALGICILDPPLYWGQLKNDVRVNPTADREEPKPPPEPPEKEKQKTSEAETSCYEQVGVCKYRSNKLGFEIDFPTGFDAREFGQEFAEVSKDVSITRIPPSGWQGRGAENHIGIRKFSKNSQDYDLLKLETLGIGETAVTNSLLPGGFTYKRIADVTVSRIRCKVFENLNPWEALRGVRGRRIHIPAKDGTFVVSGLIEGSGEQVEPWYISEEIFDQILSTFRFLDQTSTEDRIIMSQRNFEELTWSEYKNASLGVKFLYPDNYTVPKEGNNNVDLLRMYAYMFRVTKYPTTLSLNAWWESKKADYPYHTATQSTFKNKEALLLKLTTTAQVPMDRYIVRVKNNVYAIDFEVEFREEIYKTGYQKANEEFYKVDKKVTDKILNSLEFL